MTTPPQAPGQVPPQRTGRVAWVVGFLTYIPIPFVHLVVAAVTMLVVGLLQRKHGGIAARNGTRAANFGLTLLLVPLIIGAAMAIGIATGTPTSDGVRMQPWADGMMFGAITIYLVMSLVSGIYAIAGTVWSGKGEEARLPAVPFIRAPRT
ncbi:DUF4870 domain-containing protein [Propionibacteriaceae bacterium Y1685]